MKVIDEYEKYKDIPKELNGRLDLLLEKLDLSRKKNIIMNKIHSVLNMKWNKISYTIYLLPKATPRPRMGKSGIFYVKGASDNKKIFHDWFLENNFEMIKTPCKFYCTSYFPMPSSMNITDKIIAELGFIRPISKPDWDNVAKTYCDMCQDYLLYDDSLIIEGISRKYYSIKPRIEITIEYMDDFDSDFNRKKIYKRTGDKHD